MCVSSCSRAVAQAYLANCRYTGIEMICSWTALEIVMISGLENVPVREHGVAIRKEITWAVHLPRGNIICERKGLGEIISLSVI